MNSTPLDREPQKTSDQIELAFKPTRNCLSVSQITARVKGLLEGEMVSVWVQGEISSYKPSSSGHLYFSLKDSGAVLSCAMFRGQNNRVKFALKDGLEVIAHGRISVYAPRGSYQLIVDYLEPLGAGALQLAFEQLKAKLHAEGLFNPARKKPIPQHPKKIAVITSPTGAAIQDMLNILGRRNSGIEVLIVPALVQGEEAAGQLVRAVQIVNQYKLADVLVLARGGGSLEDLWCFNNEELVRAIAHSEIPTISAVGHEVDFTLCDFAADLRAPTPSAAAELVSKNRTELLEVIATHHRRLAIAMAGNVGRRKSALLALENRLVSPGEKLARTRKTLSELELRMSYFIEGKLPVYRQMADELSTKMIHLLEKKVLDRKRGLESVSASLSALSPLKVLGRGYTLTQDATTGALLKSVKDLSSGQTVDLVFQDGKAKGRIL